MVGGHAVDADTQKHRTKRILKHRGPDYGRPVAAPSAPPGTRVKRLTVDLPAELHRALKVRSAELDVPMAELLRELIDEALRKPSKLRELADRLRSGSR